MNTMIHFWTKLHKASRYVALAGLLLFVLSAMMHPLMIWTGPQPERMFPPSMVLEEDSLGKIQDILRKHQVIEPILVKAVPTKSGPALQVTEHELQPRRYFDLATGKEWQDYDEQQALWLARYYTGRNDPILEVQWISEFTSEYPWVNRLLPVYKITFDASDGYSVYVHTETNALAAISNHWKNSLQTIFQNLHTLSWLDHSPMIRVGLMSLVLGVLLMMVLSGVIQLINRKVTSKTSAKRRVHRVLAWMLFVPLFGLLISGLFHLQFQQFAENQHGMRMSSSIQIADRQLADRLELFEEGLPSFNGVSLIEFQDSLFYRVSLSPADHKTPSEVGHHESMPDESEKSTRQQRFDGIPLERSAFYVNAENGRESNLTDKAIAMKLAKDFLNLDSDQTVSATLVRHFGPEYDFRNKRLPVWKITTSALAGHRVFVDPVTSIIVDYLNPMAFTESYSFSLLHKWDFLVPAIGRKVRDSVVVIILLCSIIIALLGISIGRSKFIQRD